VKVERKSDHAVSDAACKAATGKTLGDWFLALDKHGGVALGRRDLTTWVRDAHSVDPWWCSTIVSEYEIARGDLAKDGKPKGYSICPTKIIKASPQRCFDAFASAQALDAWFGPKHEVELRDGGHWKNADGNRASVKKVNAGKNIRLIAEDAGLTLPTPVEIKFTPNGRNCTIMISVDRLQTRAEADGYRRAWGDALERLKAVLETA
jgi:uncharacterized protein YndB with AHSA1/START domain